MLDIIPNCASAYVICIGDLPVSVINTVFDSNSVACCGPILVIVLLGGGKLFRFVDCHGSSFLYLRYRSKLLAPSDHLQPNIYTNLPRENSHRTAAKES